MTPASRRQAALATLILALCCLSPCTAFSAQSLHVDADLQFGYADRLYADRDYLMAAAEYKRFVFLFPEHERVEEAAFKVGMCFQSSGQYAPAIHAFKDILATYPDGRYAVQAQFSMSEAYLRSNQAGAAITVLRNLALVTHDTGTRDEAFYRLSWIYIGMAQWEQSQAMLDEISREGRRTYRLAELSEALAEEPKMKRKSPGLAGALAVVPGAGYLYCGRYQDALIALLVNGGLIWAACEAFQNDLYALGAVITFVEVGFYAGNIYGSVSSAHKYNRKNERQWIDNLRRRLKIDLAGRPANMGFELSLRYTF